MIFRVTKKARKLNDLIPHIGFTPAMHAHGHIEKCQLQTGILWKLGIGLEDGEDCERLWAQLGNSVQSLIYKRAFRKSHNMYAPRKQKRRSEREIGIHFS